MNELLGRSSEMSDNEPLKTFGRLRTAGTARLDVAWPAERDALLVLDNREHWIDTGADLVEHLLSSASSGAAMLTNKPGTLGFRASSRTELHEMSACTDLKVHRP